MSGRETYGYAMLRHPAAHGRRGSAYVLVLGVAMAVTVIGLSVLTVVRLSGRRIRGGQDRAEAQLLAFSAAECAVVQMNTNPQWRQDLEGVTVTKPLGRGQFSWGMVDESDGDLDDDNGQPVTVLATGTVNEARHILTLQVAMSGPPLPALSTCLSAGGQVTVNSGSTAAFVGAPLSSNGAVDNRGTIEGDVAAADVIGGGTITGEVTSPAPPKQMPSRIVFETYKAGATVVTNPGTIRGKVLSPGSNPWGAPDPEGLYYIDTGGGDLVIEGSRIHGTLLVQCGPGGKVILREAALLQNYQADYPVLIVDGDVEVSCDSEGQDLRESQWHVNFNPPDTPYDGQGDHDKGDSYPNELRGLVHVRGALTMKQTARIRGTVICEGAVTFDGNNRILYDSAITQSPPTGYHTGTGQVRPGLWQRVVE